MNCALNKFGIGCFALGVSMIWLSVISRLSSDFAPAAVFAMTAGFICMRHPHGHEVESGKEKL